MTLYTHKNQSSDFMKVGELPPIEQPILLHKGDKLRVHKANLLGEPAQYNADNKLLSYAHISTTAPEIFKGVKIGEPIFLDDGQIEGHISQTSEDEFIFDIIHTKSKGGKLRADKGINLPSSNLQISGLTKKDKKDLKFVVKHADVVNLSFVNNRQDVRDLINELDQLNAKNKIGIILKIETQSGFNNLIEILLEAMQVYPIGVMIARGDLAIESGWNNIGRIQEEILSLCLSANISDIWATQVLENLAKKGIPSRAEITDAVMSQRADCVMLNKGSYILQSIHLLDTILKEMRPYRDKNAPLLPKMKPANIKVL
jgi:pyruvate kinase